MTDITALIDWLDRTGDLSDEALKILLTFEDPEAEALLYMRADAKRRACYGDAVYLRGLIEISNYCKNNCYYCGIRAGNSHAQRYRLDRDQILSCCREGYALGYRTFVLQGGEDPYFTDERLTEIISAIHSAYPDCAITLSIGERSRESYQALYDAGARRYLLRHETANAAHYGQLHPAAMSHANRRRCLYDLKEIGYQVGAGIMVGAPYQTLDHIIEDIRFMQDLEPDMIGIGPFIHHHETPFADQPDGDLYLTIRLLAVLRLLFPYVLLPATTALGTIHPQGREMGLKAGANVIMPNLSPADTRRLYELYENKAGIGEAAAQSKAALDRQVAAAGYRTEVAIGNVAPH